MILPTAAQASDEVSEDESREYYFGLMQQADSYRLKPGTAAEYLRGVWRLDKKAHVGGGHYARSDKGDDVSLFCNDERLVQIDFNQSHSRFVERTEQLSDLAMESDGSLSFGKGRRYIPLSKSHMAIADYDYIVVLKRVSGTLLTD